MGTFGSNIKSIQRDTITVAAASGSNTATLSPAVVVANTEVRYLGTDVADGSDPPYIELTNTTTITATRAQGTAGNVTVSFEITEYY